MSVLYSNSRIFKLKDFLLITLIILKFFTIPVYILNGRKQTLGNTIRILPALRMRGLHDKRHLLAKLHICDSENYIYLLFIFFWTPFFLSEIPWKVASLNLTYHGTRLKFSSLRVKLGDKLQVTTSAETGTWNAGKENTHTTQTYNHTSNIPWDQGEVTPQQLQGLFWRELSDHNLHRNSHLKYENRNSHNWYCTNPNLVQNDTQTCIHVFQEWDPLFSYLPTFKFPQYCTQIVFFFKGKTHIIFTAFLEKLLLNCMKFSNIYTNIQNQYIEIHWLYNSIQIIQYCLV